MKLKKFSELKKVDLNTIAGGVSSSGSNSNATGVETNTYTCTDSYGSDGVVIIRDSSYDGDWLSTC